MSEEWNKLDQVAKAPYLQETETQKKRYEEEMKVYKAKKAQEAEKAAAAAKAAEKKNQSKEKDGQVKLAGKKRAVPEGAKPKPAKEDKKAKSKAKETKKAPSKSKTPTKGKKPTPQKPAKKKPAAAKTPKASKPAADAVVTKIPNAVAPVTVTEELPVTHVLPAVEHHDEPVVAQTPPKVEQNHVEDKPEEVEREAESVDELEDVQDEEQDDAGDVEEEPVKQDTPNDGNNDQEDAPQVDNEESVAEEQDGGSDEVVERNGEHAENHEDPEHCHADAPKEHVSPEKSVKEAAEVEMTPVEQQHKSAHKDQSGHK